MTKDDRAEQTPDEYPDTLIGFLNLPRFKCTTCGTQRVRIEGKGWMCLRCEDGGEGGT